MADPRLQTVAEVEDRFRRVAGPEDQLVMPPDFGQAGSYHPELTNVPGEAGGLQRPAWASAAPATDPAKLTRPSWATSPGNVAGGGAKPAAEPTESPTSFGNLVGAAVEPMLHMGSGAVGAVAGGIGGIGAGINKALGISDANPADVVRNVQGALTYEPMTTGGKNAMTVIGYPFQKLGELADTAGGKTSDMLERAGVPREGAAAVGAAGNAALQFLPQFFGGKGAKALADAAPEVMPRLVPEVRPGAQAMVDKGATLTPGQLLGGAWDKAEQALSKWPIVGAPIRGARARTFEDFNVAAHNDVLAPVKEKLPEGLTGQNATAWVYDHLGERYDSILERTTGRLDGPEAPTNALPERAGQAAPAPAPTLRGQLTELQGMVDQSTLPRQYKSEFGRIIQDDIIKRFTENGGLAPGEVLKDIDTNLRVLADKKRLSDNRDVNTVGLAIQQARANLKAMIERENPQLGPELQATDAAYAKFKIIQKATVAAGKEGLFTPAQLERAVKAKDPTKDKRAFSEGRANLQDLAKAARDALGDAIPDSGTPYQAMFAALASSLPNKGLGALFSVPGGILGATALALPYSRMGTGIIQRAAQGGRGNAGGKTAVALPYGIKDTDAAP